jgi:hypothetical protein
VWTAGVHDAAKGTLVDTHDEAQAGTGCAVTVVAKLVQQHAWAASQTKMILEQNSGAQMILEQNSGALTSLMMDKQTVPEG